MNRSVAPATWIRLVPVCCLASFCLGQSGGQVAVQPTGSSAEKLWVVDLAPMSEGRLGWSAKGVKVPLTAGPDGLEGAIELGPEVAGVAPSPIRFLLFESERGKGLDRLKLDSNRNGEVDAGEILETQPKELRGKMWSSFSGTVDVTVTAPDGKSRVLPFPLALWYVLDPAEPDADPILRWSARGWMEGQFESPSGSVTVCLAESVLDATYDATDSWSLGPNPKEAHGYGAFRNLDDHNWCGEEAWRLVESHPSGLQVTLQPFDPGVTRAEEKEARDRFAADKRARRAKKPLAFSHDFAASEAAAKKDSKRLFLDFETTWCGPCKQMDVMVYTAQEVVDAARGVVCVKLDGDEQKELVKRFQVAAYPTLILLGPDGKEVRRAVGYQSVAQMKAFFQ